MKTYLVCIKSHCDAPDWEREVDAKSEKEALEIFNGLLLGEYDEKFIKENMICEDSFQK